MTTTSTSRSTDVRGDAAGVLPRTSAPARKSTARRNTIIGVVVAVGIVLGLWGASRVLKPANATDPSVFTAAKHSFAVTLLEKGELKAAKSVDVRCEVEGRSTIIQLIPEGTDVKKGDLLVQLASDEIEDRLRSQEITVANATAKYEAAEKEYDIQLDQNASDIRKAQLALENARTELKKYEEGDWPQAKMDADLELERAQKQLERAESDWESAEKLYEKKFITKSEYLSDQFAKFQGEMAVRKAKLALFILETYTHPQTRRLKGSDVQEAEKDLERVKNSATAKAAQKLADKHARAAELEIATHRLNKYREQQVKTKIYAPADGLVVYYNEFRRWGSEDNIKEGSEVRERQTIITLPDTSQMKVEVRIHEASTDKIRIGQQASVEIEGVPDRRFPGKVTKIAPLADSQNRWLNPDLKEYTTEILLEPVDDVDLKPGVTARAEIFVQDVVDQLAVPIQAVFGKAGKHYVFRQTGSEIEPVQVQLGPSSTEYVAVLDGLAEGEQVLLAVSDELQRTLPESESAPNGAGFGRRGAPAH